MSRVPLFIIATAGLTLMSPVQKLTPNLTEGLVAYYSFNQCDARDDSGNGSDGQLHGNIQCWCGIDDDGLLLDGEKDYIEFLGRVNDYFTSADFTISFYIKAEHNTLFPQSLLSKREECNEYYMLDLMLDQQHRVIDTKVFENPAKFYPNISPELDSTRWMHYALVREGVRAMTYINGELRQRGFRCSGVNIENNAPLSFSNSPCTTGGRALRFRGILDELRIYDHALTPEEIKALYDLHPIENARQDCFAQLAPPSMRESGYLCLQNR